MTEHHQEDGRAEDPDATRANPEHRASMAPAPTRAAPRHAAGSGARRVGPYRIDGELGRGGMGVVYRAFDERLQRDVALKALPVELATDPAGRERLESEARALACVNHPNVASIFGIEDSTGTLYLVLELVEGETLRERLDRERLDVDVALAFGAHVAEGLAAVHRKGLVHRDLKPSNVMVSSEGLAMLLDFGLARRARDLSRIGAAPPEEEIAGTPGYMSPEQLRGERLDARSDVFAWGCLLYECLAWTSAHPGANWGERDDAVLQRDPDWSLLPEDTPLAVRELLRDCLAKRREERPESMELASGRLEEARQGSSARRTAALLPKHALPAERDAFVGRDSELAELARLLQSGHRLVSVLGIGGAGKTRLVQHHARRTLAQWPGGAWFCDLSEARSAEGIASAVATALGVPLSKGDPVVQLGHAIAARGRCLVLLDNFEQVARHAAQTLGAWLDRCEDATFVVTTREVLGLTGEQALALAPLQQTDAEALFVARARQARAGWEPDAEEGEVIARLVRMLDQLPLALELAAARVRVMPVRQVLARMGERFKLLSSGGARRDRQATLRATLDWSWELLSEWERSALAQLSVFEGGFTLEAAEAVLDLSAWDVAPWPVDVVQALLDKSLLRRTGDERFDLLMSVQEHAGEKLEEMGARAATEQRHGRWFARLGAPETLAAVDRREGAATQRMLGRELDNLVVACRRATSRGDVEVVAASLGAAWRFIEIHGSYAVAEDLASAALELPLAAASRAFVFGVRGLALELLGRSSEAQASHAAAIALCRELDDRHGEADALARLGKMQHRHGQISEARGSLEAALALVSEIGARDLEGEALSALGVVRFEQGEVDEARACYDAALAIHRETGDLRGEGIVLANLGNQHLHHGRVDEMRACYEASLAIQRELGNRRSEAVVLGNLTHFFFERGPLEEARASVEASLAIFREIGDRRLEGMMLGNLASLLGQEKRPEEALACFEAALAIHREMGSPRFEAIALGNLGILHHRQGRPDEARACHEAALAITRECDDRRHEGITLGHLGNVHRDQGRRDEARSCYDEAERLLRDVDDVLQCAIVLCGRARLDLDEGRVDAARSAVANAEALGARAGAGEGSDLGRDIRGIHERLAEAGP